MSLRRIEEELSAISPFLAPLRPASVLLVFVTACGPEVVPSAEGSSTGEPAGETTITASSTTSMEIESGSTTGSGSGTGMATSTTNGLDDTGWPPSPCEGAVCEWFDVYYACFDDERCMPWGYEVWDNMRCSPIYENPGQPGDPCEVRGHAASGLDSCDEGSICWDVDPATNQGTCAAMCDGFLPNPICAEGTDCLLVRASVLAVCLPTCEPLADACGEGHACLPSFSGFACMWMGLSENVAVGGSCDDVYDCQPGLVCVGLTSTASEETCYPGTDPGVCVPYCDLSAPDPTVVCPNPSDVCLPYAEEGSLPPRYEDVGLCMSAK